MRLRVLAALLLTTSCAESVRARDFGEQLFGDPRVSGDRFNRASCQTCHSTSSADTRILSGGSLVDVTQRGSWFGGNALDLREAMNFCVVQYMLGAPLESEDARARALLEYLQSLKHSDALVPAARMTVVRDVAVVPIGDRARGERVYRDACQGCHGALHSGAGQLTPSAPVLPEVMKAYPVEFPRVDPYLVVVEKVRHGNGFHIGGVMPPYSLEALSDEQLGDLLAVMNL